MFPTDSMICLTLQVSHHSSNFELESCRNSGPYLLCGPPSRRRLANPELNQNPLSCATSCKITATVDHIVTSSARGHRGSTSGTKSERNHSAILTCFSPHSIRRLTHSTQAHHYLLLSVTFRFGPPPDGRYVDYSTITALWPIADLICPPWRSG